MSPRLADHLNTVSFLFNGEFHWHTECNPNQLLSRRVSSTEKAGARKTIPNCEVWSKCSLRELVYAIPNLKDQIKTACQLRNKT